MQGRAPKLSVGAQAKIWAGVMFLLFALTWAAPAGELKVGDAVPGFSAKDQFGIEFKFTPGLRFLLLGFDMGASRPANLKLGGPGRRLARTTRGRLYPGYPHHARHRPRVCPAQNEEISPAHHSGRRCRVAGAVPAPGGANHPADPDARRQNPGGALLASCRPTAGAAVGVASTAAIRKWPHAWRRTDFCRIPARRAFSIWHPNARRVPPAVP